MTNELNIWKKIEIVAFALAALATPIIVAFVGHWYSQSMKEREVQCKFVELSVEILRTNPTEETKNLRDWATQILDKYSGVPITPKTREELVKLGPIPVLGMATPECLEYLRRATELLDVGERDGGLAYLKKARELCGK